MFETEKSRREFIQAMKAGKVGLPLVQKAISLASAFSDCTVEEIAWTATHPQPLVQQFGAAIQQLIGGAPPAAAGGDGLLEQLMREKAPQRIEQLAQAIVERKDPELGTQLSQMVNDRNPEVRQKAMALLVRMEDWPRQRGLVQALLDDPRSEIGEPMLQHVIRSAPRAYLRELRRGAAHANEELRALCLKTLVAMNQLKNADIVLQRLPREKGELQKSLYGALLTWIKQDPVAMTEVVIAALAAAEPEVRSAALSLVVKLPDPRASFKRLLEFSASVSAIARDELFGEMARNAEAWVELVLNLFKTEQQASLRFQAMSLAKVLSHPRLAPIFLHEMKSADWMVRYAAMQVLGDMKAEQALPALIEALNSEDSALAAIQALDKYRDVRLAKSLFGRIVAGSETEQIEILKALANMNDARLLPNIAKFLDSSAPKGAAKKFAAETIIQMCEASQTAVPPRVTQIYDSLREKSIDDLPDLGLRLSLD